MKRGRTICSDADDDQQDSGAGEADDDDDGSIEVVEQSQFGRPKFAGGSNAASMVSEPSTAYRTTHTEELSQITVWALTGRRQDQEDQKNLVRIIFTQLTLGLREGCHVPPSEVH
jgi:hypothetical protein